MLCKLNEHKLSLFLMFCLRQKNSSPLHGCSPGPPAGCCRDAPEQEIRGNHRLLDGCPRNELGLFALAGLRYGGGSHNPPSLTDQPSVWKLDPGPGPMTVNSLSWRLVWEAEPWSAAKRGLLGLGGGEREWLGRGLGMGKKEPQTHASNFASEVSRVWSCLSGSWILRCRVQTRGRNSGCHLAQSSGIYSPGREETDKRRTAV